MAPRKSPSSDADRVKAKRPTKPSKPGHRLSVEDLARFPEENPNPVLRALVDGTLIYANSAATILLETLDWRIGKKLPSALRKQMLSDAVDRSAEFDLRVGERTYAVATCRGGQGRDVSLYFRNVTIRRHAEQSLRRLNAELKRHVAEQTSEIRRSYEALKDERQRLYDVLETLPVYVILLTKDYHVTYANRFFEERFGKSEGRRCFEYLFGRTEPCENCETYKVFSTGEPHHWEWTGPDGRNYDIHDFPFVDTDGSQLVMEMGIDVTEVHKARALLEEANRTLEQRVAERTADLAQTNRRLLAEIDDRRRVETDLLLAKEDWERTFNSVPDLIAILDDQHRIVRVNRAMARALAVEPEQCAGLSCFKCVHGTDSFPEFCPHTLTLKDRREHSAEVHEQRLGGDFLVTTTPMFNAAGELIGSVHVAHDITERKQSEQALRESREDLNRAQAVARVGSWRMDMQRNLLTWSEENHRLFAIPKGTAMSYETFLAAVHPDDRADVDRAWSAAIHGEPYDIEHRIVVNGQVKWVRERAELEFDDQGTLLGGFGTTQDITERKLTETALRELNETLESRVAERTAVAERRASLLRRMTAELSRAEHHERNRLATILHDDLQQLLLAARMRLAGIMDGPESSRRGDVQMVDGLLDECMRASRDLTMELSPPILRRGTLGEVVEWVSEWFGEKHGLSVVVESTEAIPPVREHVQVFLFHAIRELLMNTVKHSGRREARILLALDDGCVRIQVEDQGADFDAEVVRRKLDNAQSFGLLSIRERLEALEGRLEFESTPSGGARFRLIVPLAATAQPALE